MATLKGVHWSLAERVYWVQEQSKTLASKPFWVTTGFRSQAEQVYYYDKMLEAIAQYGEPAWRKYAALAAKPGTSNHQHEEPKGTPDARAVDLACQARDNALRITLIQQAGLCTPVAGEPWHVEERIGIPLPEAPGGDEMPLSKYIIVPCPTGGYWELKRSDGGVGSQQGAPFFGAMPGVAKVVAPIASLTPCVKENAVVGYWIQDEAGHVYSFGRAPHYDGYAEHSDWHSPNRKMTGLVQTAGWTGARSQVRYAQIGEEIGDADYVVDTYDLGPEYNRK